MRYFLTFLLLCFVVNSFAANNYITIQVNAGMNYDINTTAELEAAQTITNSFQLKVLNNSNACHVYVRISAWNYPAAWVPIANYPLQVIWSSDDSPNDANVASTTTVTTSDQLLFTQPSHAGTTPYNYYYKLKLLALGYTDYVPGNYNYTFTFTMTEP